MRPCGLVALFALFFAGFAAADINDKSDMQPIIQLDFGPFGSHLPGDGQDYCYPTTWTMLTFWLHDHGYSQLGTSFSDSEALSLDRVLGGLMHTTASGGTGVDASIAGFTDYLSAKGISSSDMTWETSYNPTLDWYNSHNGDHSVVLAGLSWFRYDATAGVYIQDGGHGVALEEADPGAETMTVNNAYPATLYNVLNVPASDPQTVSISTISGTGLDQDVSGTISQYEVASDTYIQAITPILGPGNAGGLGVFDTGVALTLADEAKPANASYSIATWTLNGKKTLNTNGGFLSVIAPLEGTGGIDKEGDGELQLQSTDDLSGDNTVTAGTLSSTGTNGTPFGTGKVSLVAGTLELEPDDTTPAALTQTIASGSDARLEVDGGGATLGINRGANTSLSVTIGGNTAGTERNIAFNDRGTLVMSVATGLDDLGGAVKILLAGGAGNRPDIHNGMITANHLGEDSDASHSGAFLTYDADRGFIKAATTSGDINAATGTTVYETSVDRTITSGGTASVYALQADHANILGDASTTLAVGSQDASDSAGIILNGSRIEAGTLALGASTAYVYTSGDDGTIASAISGSGDFVKFGEGGLTLSGNSAATQTGNIDVNSGVLHVASGGATGSGNVEVRNGATLKVSGVVNGAVTVLDNATTMLDDSGTIQGGITVNPLGTLEGGGTINGTSDISGSVAAGDHIGTLTFGGATTFENNSLFYWSLTSAVDNKTGQAGVDWNSLNFLSTVQFGDNSPEVSDALTMYLDIPLSFDPNSGDAFWDSREVWTFATAAGTGAFDHSDFSIENWSWLSGSFDWEYDDSQSKLDLVFTPAVVPEPGAGFLLVAGGLALWAGRRTGRR